jgi:hypothetical protein
MKVHEIKGKKGFRSVSLRPIKKRRVPPGGIGIVEFKYSFHWDSIPNPGSFFCSPKRTKPRKRRFPFSFNRHTTISLAMVTILLNTKNQQLPGLRPLDGPQSLRRKMQRLRRNWIPAFAGMTLKVFVSGIAPLEKSQWSDEGRG